jgi:hypothetical protein
MYDEGADAAGGPAPSLGGAVRKFNLEGLIPLILLVIIGVASLNYFGIVDVPYLPKGSERVQVLVIGTPSLGEKTSLDNLNYFLNWTSRDAASFGNAASETLKDYFNGEEIRVTFGKGTKTFDSGDVSRSRAAYSYFSNLKIYKFAVGDPNIQFADFSTLPEGLIELSLDGSNWSNYLDNNLPIQTGLREHGDCVEFFVRNKIPSAAIKKSFQRSTAYLSVAWEVVQ